MRRILTTALIALAPWPALAEDIAVVIANQRYDSFPNVREAAAATDAVRVLEDADFEVIEIRDERFAGAVASVAAARSRIASADRVVVLLAGHVVTGAGQGWLLTRDARAPDDVNVGAQALPLTSILGMAAQHPGAAAVLITPSGSRLSLGPGLTEGVQFESAPQGVTILTGSMRGLVSALRDGLLVPGLSLAEVVADLPSSVAASGFVSEAVAFLPFEERARPEAPRVTSELPRDPQADAEAAEAALGLDREARRNMQRDLSILGYDPRGIDGLFGRGTRSAIRAWQIANGFGASGYLSGNQITRLQEQGARRAAELEAEARKRQEEQDRRDTAYWRETGANGTEEGLRAYLDSYPDGLFADLAQERLSEFEDARRASAARAEREFWDDVVSADTAQAYDRYLEGYPQGAFRQEAEARLSELRAEEGRADAEAEARADEERVAGNPITRLLVEQRLRQLGLDPGRIDGNFDKDTRRAVRRFQRARDLPDTGYVTQATLVRLLASG